MTEATAPKNGIDNEAIAKKVAESLAEKLASGNMVVVHPPAKEENKENMARDALVAARMFGTDAIRFAFIINGGAITAILAYLGSGNSAGDQLVCALALFAAGALFAVGAAVCAYLAQSALADRYLEWGGKAPCPRSPLSIVAVSLLCLCAALAAAGAALSFQEMRNAEKPGGTTFEIKISKR